MTRVKAKPPQTPPVLPPGPDRHAQSPTPPPRPVSGHDDEDRFERTEASVIRVSVSLEEPIEDAGERVGQAIDSLLALLDEPPEPVDDTELSSSEVEQLRDAFASQRPVPPQILAKILKRETS